MGKSQETFNKKEKEKKRLKKRQDKAAKREERKSNPKPTSFEDMIVYVDEYGQLTDTPPDPTKKLKFKAEDIEIGIPKKEKEEIDPIRNGKVEFFNSEKGFGFIKEDGTNEKFFVHVSSLTGEIEEGEKVSFELEQGLKGLNAVRVKKI
ncbi:MAG: cold shock domain-containing protein [Flavobacteriales bacterium]|nr:cold shock domain-containing protein [Flavobacteriales bacterium]MDG1766491.1 cold shock domain-containing protein [Flavobacteriales bacterium]